MIKKKLLISSGYKRKIMNKENLF